MSVSTPRTAGIEPSLPEKKPPRPNKHLALGIAFVLPPGVAHAYVGLWKRGAVLAAGVVLVLVALGGSMIVAGANAKAWIALLVTGAWVLGRAVGAFDVVRQRAHYIPASPNRAFLRFALGWAVFGAISIGTAVGLRRYVVESFKVPSNGMAPTLFAGDYFFADKRTTEPRRGDVMVFRFPERPEQDMIQRVVGLPGDRIDMRDGHPVVNGVPVRECLVGTMPLPTETNPFAEGDVYLEAPSEAAYLTVYDRFSESPAANRSYTVKDGEYFTLGDNRNNGYDSRVWFGGQGAGAPRANMKGRALAVWLSLSNGSVDWSRTFLSLAGATLPSSGSTLEAGLTKCKTELSL